jgi:hypothetical protein
VGVFDSPSPEPPAFAGAPAAPADKDKGSENMSTPTLPAQNPIPADVAKLVGRKHREYLRLSSLNCYAYYSTTTIAVLCSVLLPFVVGTYQSLATILAIAVAITVALDRIFTPRDNWELYSNASDLLTIAELEATGQYERCKKLLDILVDTESRKLARVTDLKAVLEQVRATPPSH